MSNVFSNDGPLTANPWDDGLTESQLEQGLGYVNEIESQATGTSGDDALADGPVVGRIERTGGTGYSWGWGAAAAWITSDILGGWCPWLRAMLWSGLQAGAAIIVLWIVVRQFGAR